MTHTILITHGVVVSETGVLNADVLIEGDKIKALGATGSFDQQPPADLIIEAKGKLILPGLIDPHLHFNSPFMGTVTTHGYDNGTRAAAYGGITTIIDFSTQPKGGSILKNLEQKEREAEGKAYIDWSVSGILLDATPQTLAEIPELIKAGCPTYKCFTTYKQAGRLMDDDSMLLILEATAREGGMLMVHCEHDAIINYLREKALAEHHYAPLYHALTRPPETENIAIQRVIDLMRQVTAPVYIVHTSTAESVRIIQNARLDGLPLHSETCTHYLTLTDEMLERPDGQLFICSPPLRKKRDIEALWNALRIGSLEVVSSDDAGVPPEDNWRIGQGRFDLVPSGISSIEPRLSILYTEGVCKGRISLPRLVQITSTNPARLFGLYPQKGHLNPGADADLVIYNPEGRWTMSADTLHMNTTFCAFDGWEICGSVETVISRGQFVIREGDFVGDPNHGKRVFRKLDNQG